MFIKTIYKIIDVYFDWIGNIERLLIHIHQHHFYANGQDSIAFHSDDEYWLGDQSCIVSLSLGAKRDFHMKNKSNENLKQNFVLNSGDLIVMRGKNTACLVTCCTKKNNTIIGKN